MLEAAPEGDRSVTFFQNFVFEKFEKNYEETDNSQQTLIFKSLYHGNLTFQAINSTRLNSNRV